jgi:hypothetical protein
LRESSALLLQRVEQLAEMSNIMADGGEGEFLSQLSEHRLGPRGRRTMIHEVEMMVDTIYSVGWWSMRSAGVGGAKQRKRLINSGRSCPA